MERHAEIDDPERFAPIKLRIYVISADELVRSKIGVSGRDRRDPEGRVRELQRMSPVLLRFHCAYEAPEYLARAVEKEVHGLLANVRLYGEWFDCDPKTAEKLVVDRLGVDRDWPSQNAHKAAILLGSGIDDDSIIRRLMKMGFTCAQARGAVLASAERSLDDVVLKDRNAAIVALLRSGRTLGQIGRRFNLTPERVRQIGQRHSVRSRLATKWRPRAREQMTT